MNAPPDRQRQSTGALVTADPWSNLRSHTPANVAIGRVGQSLPTREVLRFGLAHAQARDAVHFALDVEVLASALREAGWNPLAVRSAAGSREVYLRRPDLGRRLDPDSADMLERAAGELPSGSDLCFVLGDGLSAVAVQGHAVPLLQQLRLRLQAAGVAGADRLQDARVVVATQARVALGDDIAARLRARMVVVLIGERPGLSSPDSLGIYLTWAPQIGRTDAERNCISNVRMEGLSYPAAAAKLAWLIEQAFERRLTGVALKDESDRAALNFEPGGIR